jgi:hypothetical protein
VIFRPLLIRFGSILLTKVRKPSSATLVIPSDTLWQVDYDSDGNVKKPLHRVDEATLFIRHSWSGLIGDIEKISYGISHLHIVTLPYLEEAVELWMGPTGFLANNQIVVKK